MSRRLVACIMILLVSLEIVPKNNSTFVLLLAVVLNFALAQTSSLKEFYDNSKSIHLF